MEYRITSKRHLKQLNLFFGFAAIATIIAIWFTYQDLPKKYIWFCPMMVLVQTPFLWVIHSHVAKINNDDLLTVTDDRYVYLHKGQEIMFGLSDISNVLINKSISLRRRGSYITLWDHHTYTVIALNSGNSITLTSLMVGDDFEVPVEESKKKYKYNLFRWAPESYIVSI